MKATTSVAIIVHGVAPPGCHFMRTISAKTPASVVAPAANVVWWKWADKIYPGADKKTGQKIELWVADAGPGAPELEGNSIFERFYRAADQEPDPKGLGLGLWIVKSIVERHGGEVRAARTPAGLTRFTVTLPLVAGAS